MKPLVVNFICFDVFRLYRKSVISGDGQLEAIKIRKRTRSCWRFGKDYDQKLTRTTMARYCCSNYFLSNHTTHNYNNNCSKKSTKFLTVTWKFIMKSEFPSFLSFSPSHCIAKPSSCNYKNCYYKRSVHFSSPKHHTRESASLAC